jgi:nicotinate dehydrogenase subunit A
MIEQITLKVNQQEHTFQVERDTPLLYVLRNDLGLKAVKFACGLGQCGACKVLINGLPEPACKVPAGAVQGMEIITIEGLGSRENLHPIQRAFIREGAIQCGFCVGGMIIGAKALLDRNPNPSDREIREALAIHLCRCGVHNRVVRAVKRAAFQQGNLAIPEQGR